MTLPVLRIVEREAQVYRRLWRGSIISSFAAPLFFLGAMGYGLGGLVDERNADVAGVPYLQFVAPGLLAAFAMQATAGGALWPVLGGFKWSRTYHGIVATPVPPDAVFLVVAAVLGAVPSAWGVLALPAAILCAAAFAAPLAAFVATQDTDATFPIVFRIVIVPLFLFSGTFFPIDQLPAGLRPVAALSPLWHGVELTRGATTGTLGWGSLVHVAALLAVVGAGAWWGRRTFRQRLAA